MVSELVNVSMGMRANGSCRLINTFSMSFITVRSCIPENVATKMVGKIAMLRVNRTRTQRFHLRFKKPLIKKKKKEMHEILRQENARNTLLPISTHLDQTLNLWKFRMFYNVSLHVFSIELNKLHFHRCCCIIWFIQFNALSVCTIFTLQTLLKEICCCLFQHIIITYRFSICCTAVNRVNRLKSLLVLTMNSTHNLVIFTSITNCPV